MAAHAATLAAAEPAAEFDALAARLSEPAAVVVGRPPVTIDGSRAALRAAVVPLDALLRRSKSGSDWRRYLDWEALDQLSRSTSPDATSAARFERLFAADHDGLSMKEFADVHRALRRMVAVGEAAGVSAGDAAPQPLLESSRRLAEILRDRDPAGRPTRLREAGPLLERLADAGVALPVVSELRDRLFRSNVLLDVEERLVAGAADRPVDETAPVDEVILGIRNRGMGTTTGAVRLDFVPSSTTAAFDLVFEAVNQSRTRGGQRGVTVCSSGVTDLFARRRVLLDGRRASGLPVLAHAQTDTRTEGIGVSRHLGRGIIRRIAAGRAERMRPEAEAISSGRARDRLAMRFGRETDESIGRMTSDLATRLWRPIDEMGLSPARLETSTSDTAMAVTALEALSHQIGASSQPPVNDPDAVLSARVHASAIENAADIRFSGRRVTREDVEGFYRDRGREIPQALLEEPKQSDDEDGDPEAVQQDAGKPETPKPWSVTFRRDRPVAVLTEKDRVTIRLHFSDMESDGRSTGPMEIGVPYRVERHETGARLVRDVKILDDIQVSPPGGWSGAGGSPNRREALIRLRLRRRIDKAAPSSFEDPLELTGRLAVAGPLPIEHMQVTEDGWLAIGWRAKGDASSHDEEIPIGIPADGPPSVAVQRAEIDPRGTALGSTASNGRIQIERN